MGILIGKKRLSGRLDAMLPERCRLSVLPLALGPSRKPVPKPCDGGIGLRIEIRHRIHIGILDRPLVQFADSPGSGRKGIAVARLVAKRPQDDGGMVAKGANHPLDALQNGRTPLGTIARQNATQIGKPVRFDVGFRKNRKPDAIADFVP